jgi:Cu-Zn family superoxide dismutase
MLRPMVALTCALALTVTGCSALMPKPTVYQAVLAPTVGNSVAGTLFLSVVPNGVHIHGRLTGLAPGSTHGFHVHEHGDCSAPDASTAGGHFNPTGSEHGDPAGLSHHAGDIPNLVADARGAVDVIMHDVSLATSTSDDVLGRALIVHRDTDDYMTQPSGNSGPRLACGVIMVEPKKP